MRIERGTVAIAVVIVACGSDAVVHDAAAPEDASEQDAAVAFDATTSDVSDASVDNYVFDAWAGCPNNPVVCMDADYHVTVNGNGAPQVLRYDTVACGTPDAAYYHVPIAWSYAGMPGPPGIIEAALLDQCLGGNLPDGGSIVSLYFGGIDYSQTTKQGTLAYSSSYADAAASITFTRSDPIGGIVAGTYSGLVKEEVGPNGATMTLWGDFVACRVCDRPLPP